MAKAFDAEVILLHISPKFDVYATAAEVFVHAQTLTDGLLKKSEEKMKELLNRESLKGIKVIGATISGKPADEILAAIDEKKVDMVIMGTHGKNVIDQTLFGSVAAKVARMSPVPVLTVRP